jgi:hypothetical protein
MLHRAIGPNPNIALVDLATIFAIPNRRKIPLDGREDRGVELGISQLVHLWTLVFPIAFGTADLSSSSRSLAVGMAIMSVVRRCSRRRARSAFASSSCFTRKRSPASAQHSGEVNTVDAMCHACE